MTTTPHKQIYKDYDAIKEKLWYRACCVITHALYLPSNSSTDISVLSRIN